MIARPRASNRRKQEPARGATAGLSSSVFSGNRCTAGQASSGTLRLPGGRWHDSRRCLFRRTGGYTLVELLVTITIIAIIAGFALGGLFAAQEAARRNRTRAIIAKLHGQMMLRWETYETRRVPLVRGPMETPRSFAARRLEALREIMRMELPDRWTDILQAPITMVASGQTMSRPALSLAYLRRYDGNTDPLTGTPSPPTALYQSAECLYLILSMGHDDALGTDRINMREVGDVDQDGMKEFLDGWGNPIRFLRWAPGFLPVADPNHADETAAPARDSSGNALPWPRAVTDLQTGDPVHDPDPFDFRGVDQFTQAGQIDSADTDRGYRLMPLIYSSGPDGKPDIKGDHEDTSNGTFLNYAIHFNDPYVKLSGDDQVPGAVIMIGAPYDFDQDGFEHMDNITNHRLDVSRQN